MKRTEMLAPACLLAVTVACSTAGLDGGDLGENHFFAAPPPVWTRPTVLTQNDRDDTIRQRLTQYSYYINDDDPTIRRETSMFFEQSIANLLAITTPQLVKAGDENRRDVLAGFLKTLFSPVPGQELELALRRAQLLEKTSEAFSAANLFIVSLNVSDEVDLGMRVQLDDKAPWEVAAGTYRVYVPVGASAHKSLAIKTENPFGRARPMWPCCNEGAPNDIKAICTIDLTRGFNYSVDEGVVPFPIMGRKHEFKPDTMTVSKLSWTVAIGYATIVWEDVANLLPVDGWVLVERSDFKAGWVQVATHAPGEDSPGKYQLFHLLPSDFHSKFYDYGIRAQRVKNGKTWFTRVGTILDSRDFYNPLEVDAGVPDDGVVDASPPDDPPDPGPLDDLPDAAPPDDPSDAAPPDGDADGDGLGPHLSTAG